MDNLIDKIKAAGLRGRGGGGFSVYQKWKSVIDTPSDKKYVICNGAEGEPEGFKDGYILDNHLEDVMNGISLAMKEIGAEKAYLYLRKDYYEKYQKAIGSYPIEAPLGLIRKPDIGYIGGEETIICQVIEEQNLFPRKKPPYLSEKGLFGQPTLINNVETFYYVSKISKDEYAGERFYSISGDIDNPGVYELKEDDTIIEVLKHTGNYPDFDFFAQVGGISGEIFLPSEMDKPLDGAGFINVYNSINVDHYSFLERLSQFFHEGNCDKCTPCSGGFYLINEMCKKKQIDFNKLEDILLSLKVSSFCALGKNAYLPFETFINKITKDGKH
ncbi:MAG: NADH-ubiquinone oxidoreductase-F iron-sulfur binding region domain-containing protein [Candidatus Pacebacteria bacterium]|nr:NADH-ubiquinone oxidoreductase-F iron-sulfur binding region domain-containing protein [Candidatus Paceibacterota bacterium]